jgi:hypothetical protein
MRSLEVSRGGRKKLAIRLNKDGPSRLEERILELFGALDVHRLEDEVKLLGRRRSDLGRAVRAAETLSQWQGTIKMTTFSRQLSLDARRGSDG